MKEIMLKFVFKKRLVCTRLSCSKAAKANTTYLVLPGFVHHGDWQSGGTSPNKPLSVHLPE